MREDKMRERTISGVCCASLMIALLIACTYGLFGPAEKELYEQVILSCIGALSLSALILSCIDMFECWIAMRKY